MRIQIPAACFRGKKRATANTIEARADLPLNGSKRLRSRTIPRNEPAGFPVWLVLFCAASGVMRVWLPHPKRFLVASEVALDVGSIPTRHLATDLMGR